MNRVENRKAAEQGKKIKRGCAADWTGEPVWFDQKRRDSVIQERPTLPTPLIYTRASNRHT